MKRINKPTLLALVFFGAMTLVGFSAAHAQSDTLNPLFSTTGPNVLPSSSIQWNSTLDFYHLAHNLENNSHYSFNTFGATTGLRFGVGSRAELTLDISGARRVIQESQSVGPCVNSQHYNPSVGVKLLLADGKGWLPQVAFFTHVGMAIDQSQFNPTAWSQMVQPQIGFIFRNRLDSRWVLDYSLGYSWNKECGLDNNLQYLFKNQLQYSIFARKLLTDRLSTGVGISNANSCQRMAGSIEARYLATPTLQLSLQGGLSFGAAKGSNANQTYALLGAHWTLR